MEITRQLYRLQELDIEIEKAELALALKTGQLGKHDTLDAVKEKLTTAQKRLDELKHQRHDAEWQVDDLLSKIAATEQQLYGGKVTNPKELANLQHEINTLKSRNDTFEDKALEIIELVEEAEKSVAAIGSEYQTIEEEWHRQQKQLAGEIEQLQAGLASFKQQRAQLAGQFDASIITLYEKIRQQKKQAVAKVEQGICRACRISLSASALQRARSGQPVQCDTCGRILFIS
jgi:predicted  nucleic acid-binding Zn-ribbon protein